MVRIKFSGIGKSIKYAAGEILLVVIGILIALQINNWNENRKSAKQEEFLLRQLQSDVHSNLLEVGELNKRLHINKIGIDSLISKLNIQLYDKSIPVYLGQMMRKTDFNSSSSGYNMMQSGKASLISNDYVLRSVLNLYENDLSDITDRQMDMNNSINDIQKNFINKYFVQTSNGLAIQFKDLDVVSTQLFEPIDFNIISNNIEFKNTVIQLGKLVETRLAYLKKTEEQLKKTINILDAELKK